MKRTELERAWPAAEPPPGFSERVMERLQLGAVLSEPVLPAAVLPTEPVPPRARANHLHDALAKARNEGKSVILLRVKSQGGTRYVTLPVGKG